MPITKTIFYRHRQTCSMIKKFCFNQNCVFSTNYRIKEAQIFENNHHSRIANKLKVRIENSKWKLLSSCFQWQRSSLLLMRKSHLIFLPKKCILFYQNLIHLLDTRLKTIPISQSYRRIWKKWKNTLKN